MVRGERRVCHSPSECILPSLSVGEVGFHATGPEFSVGPRSVKSFGLVYLEEGRGWVVHGGRRAELNAGDIFVVFPNVRYAFAAGQKYPWDVYWCNFSGRNLHPSLRRIGIAPRHFLCKTGDPKILSAAFQGMLQHAGRNSAAAALKAAHALWELLLEMSPEDRRTQRVERNEGVHAARRYLETHASEIVSIDFLADCSRLSRFHFMRAFKKEFGTSPRQFAIRRRIAEARQLLAAGHSAKDVSHRLGFSDLFYFSRLFKQKCGVAPTVYARQRFFAPEE